MGLAYNLLGRLFGTIFTKNALKSPKCTSCKLRMERGESEGLFLLPLHSDQDYTPSASYYLKNCCPITDVSQIPTGRRACRIFPMVCSGCGSRMARVEDFLRVRNEEVLERLFDCEYKELLPLISVAREMQTSGRSE